MKNKVELTFEPTLAEPGAGISAIEMFILRFYIKPLMMKRLDTEDALRSLNDGCSKIVEQIDKFKQDELTKRILVKRPYFVEDSSRYWSAAMLCNHVGKVNGALAKAMENRFTALAGKDYIAKDRLKAVKPEIEKNVVQEVKIFQQSVERIRAAVKRQSIDDLNNRVIPHPWFGNLTYMQWIWFAGFHMKIHAKQLKQIYIGL